MTDARIGAHRGMMARDLGDPLEREARERVQFFLAMISTVVWFVVTFSAAVLLDIPHTDRPYLVLPLGFAMLPLAALPWLGMRAWVRAETRRLANRPARRSARRP
jgi:hypothetical protein